MILDQPYVSADLSTTIRCDETCNFTFLSNPPAEYVSLESTRGKIYRVITKFFYKSLVKYDKCTSKQKENYIYQIT